MICSTFQCNLDLSFFLTVSSNSALVQQAIERQSNIAMDHFLQVSKSFTRYCYET